MKFDDKTKNNYGTISLCKQTCLTLETPISLKLYEVLKSFTKEKPKTILSLKYLYEIFNIKNKKWKSFERNVLKRCQKEFKKGEMLFDYTPAKECGNILGVEFKTKNNPDFKVKTHEEMKASLKETMEYGKKIIKEGTFFQSDLFKEIIEIKKKIKLLIDNGEIEKYEDKDRLLALYNASDQDLAKIIYNISKNSAF